MRVIGDELRRQREKRGWTQDQLAQRAGLTRPAINMIESGKRKRIFAETADAIERAFQEKSADAAIADAS